MSICALHATAAAAVLTMLGTCHAPFAAPDFQHAGYVDASSAGDSDCLSNDWHGHAQMLDVRMTHGKIHVRSSPRDEIEIRAHAREPEGDANFVLRTVRRGSGVIVYVAPRGLGNWFGHSPVVDLEVRVPKGVALHASAAADS